MREFVIVGLIVCMSVLAIASWCGAIALAVFCDWPGKWLLVAQALVAGFAPATVAWALLGEEP